MAAEAACAFSAVTPTESLLPPEKIPLIVLAPAEILLISITGRMTGVVSMSSDSTIERFASVFLVESKASPATPSAALLTIWEYPSKPFTRPISMDMAIIIVRNRENTCSCGGFAAPCGIVKTSHKISILRQTLLMVKLFFTVHVLSTLCPSACFVHILRRLPPGRRRFCCSRRFLICALANIRCILSCILL